MIDLTSSVVNVNKLLCQKIKELVIRCSKTEQYSRRECLEIVGIPDNIKHDDLVSKSLEIFDQINVKLSPDDIEDCHRVGNKGRIIIKMSRRKDAQRILANKRKLKSLDSSKIGLVSGIKIYINESLCGSNRGLWIKSKILQKNRKIHSFWTSNGSIKLRIEENEKIFNILYDDDLQDLFPEVDFSSLT